MLISHTCIHRNPEEGLIIFKHPILLYILIKFHVAIAKSLDYTKVKTAFKFQQLNSTIDSSSKVTIQMNQYHI